MGETKCQVHVDQLMSAEWLNMGNSHHFPWSCVPAGGIHMLLCQGLDGPGYHMCVSEDSPGMSGAPPPRG